MANNYISEIIIENFESHVYTKLKFKEGGVNVIIGESNLGKSGIFRAFGLVLRNRPLGYSFKPYGSDDKVITTITITMSNGDIIKRIRSKTDNMYVLNSVVFKAFGTDPPEEILQALNLDQRVNVQNQGDPFFLLQSSSGDVAKHLNEIAKLEDIDKCHQQSDMESRRISGEIKQYTRQKEENQDKLDQYKDFTLAESIGKKLSALSDNFDLVKRRLEEHKNITSSYRQCYDKITSFEGLKDCLVVQSNLNSLIYENNQCKERLNTTQKLLTTYKETISKSEAFKGLSDCTSIYTDIDYLLKEKQALTDNIRALNDISNVFNLNIDKLHKVNKQVAIADKQFKDNFPDVCPLCGSESNNERS